MHANQVMNTQLYLFMTSSQIQGPVICKKPSELYSKTKM